MVTAGPRDLKTPRTFWSLISLRSIHQIFFETPDLLYGVHSNHSRYSACWSVRWFVRWSVRWSAIEYLENHSLVLCTFCMKLEHHKDIKWHNTSKEILAWGLTLFRVCMCVCACVCVCVCAILHTSANIWTTSGDTELVIDINDLFSKIEKN